MRGGQRAHECESLASGIRIDLATAGERPHLNAVERFTNELGLRHAALTGSSFQHSIMTRFYVDLFPNHRSGFHTSQYTSLTAHIAITSLLHTDEHSHLEPVRYAKGSGFFRLLMSPHVPGESAPVRLIRVLVAMLRHPIHFLRAYFVDDWRSGP